MKQLFYLDDRTGKRSTTKLIRWLSWIVTAFSIINLQCMIYFNWVDITPEDVGLLNIVERLLMALSGSAEFAYQFNRSQKMKHGTAELEGSEKIQRVEI